MWMSVKDHLAEEMKYVRIFPAVIAVNVDKGMNVLGQDAMVMLELSNSHFTSHEVSKDVILGLCLGSHCPTQSRRKIMESGGHKLSSGGGSGGLLPRNFFSGKS